jgi:AcrR family transcriptional regulator
MPDGAMRPPSKTTDRRVMRTHRLLHEALLELILERGWDAISVQEICERADIGRSTFYVHFADKQELLLSGFQPFRRQLRVHVAAAPARPLAFVGPLVEHVRDHQRLFRALVGKRSGLAVQKELLKIIGELLVDEVASTIPAGAQRTAVVRYAAGAFLELLIWWLDTRTGLDAGQIEQLLLQLTAAVLVQGRALPQRAAK